MHGSSAGADPVGEVDGTKVIVNSLLLFNQVPAKVSSSGLSAAAADGMFHKFGSIYLSPG